MHTNQHVRHDVTWNPAIYKHQIFFVNSFTFSALVFSFLNLIYICCLINEQQCIIRFKTWFLYTYMCTYIYIFTNCPPAVYIYIYIYIYRVWPKYVMWYIFRMHVSRSAQILFQILILIIGLKNTLTFHDFTNACLVTNVMNLL